MQEIHGTKGPDLIPVTKGHVMATYKVRAREGRTVKMSGAIQDLDEITRAMQIKKVATDLIATCEALIEYRDEAGVLGFQLEKADRMIDEMRKATAAATE